MTFRFRIGEYIQDMQSDGKINSPSTVRIYISRLNILADQVGNRDPRTVGREDVKRTLQRWSPSSKAHARSIFVELVVISLHGNVADLLLDDGEMLRFDIAELRRALAA